MDLGECPKVHDYGLRADYENASKEKDYYYDVEVSFDERGLKTFMNKYLKISVNGSPASIYW